MQCSVEERADLFFRSQAAAGAADDGAGPVRRRLPFSILLSPLLFFQEGCHGGEGTQQVAYVESDAFGSPLTLYSITSV